MTIPGVQSLISFINYLFPKDDAKDIMHCVFPFGACEWQKAGLSIYEPPIPEHISNHLNEQCPFWPDKLVNESHFLFLVPDKVNLKKLYELDGSSTNSPFIHNANDFAENPYWVLLTKKSMPGTRNLSDEHQDDFASRHGYIAPTNLEAAVAVVAAKRSGFVIFPSMGQDTRCKPEGDSDPVFIGSDPVAPFGITTDDCNCPNGLAGVYVGLEKVQ
jgi:hypothetical protein